MSVTAVPLQPVKASYKIWLWVGIVFAILIAGALAWVGTSAVRAQHLPAGEDAKFLEWHKHQAGVVTTASGLQYQVIRPGQGGTPGDGDFTMIGVEGKLRDGTTFQPYQSSPMRVGDGIKGFNEALKLAPKGSKIRVWVPAGELGYPADKLPPMTGITATSMLIFDVDMFNFVSEAELRAMQEKQALEQQQMQQALQAQGGGAPGGPGGAPGPGGPEGAGPGGPAGPEGQGPAGPEAGPAPKQ
jgi:FKBP-type peptidyl-prolyl cis-trans isomerase FkpA